MYWMLGNMSRFRKMLSRDKAANLYKMTIVLDPLYTVDHRDYGRICQPKTLSRRK